MVFNYKILFILLSIISLASNYFVFKSNQIQELLLVDASENLYSLNSGELLMINSEYPSLAINTVPISTYLSRYYSNEKKYEKAIKLLKKSIIKNPYNLYSRYILSRNHVLMGNLQLAEQELSYIFDRAPNLQSSSILYFSVLGELQKKEVLELLLPKIQELEDKLIIDYYYQNLILSEK